VTAKGSVSGTTTVTIKKSHEVAKDAEIDIRLGKPGQHATRCKSIFAPIGLITRIDMKGPVEYDREYKIFNARSGGWLGLTIDTTKVQITPSFYAGFYGLKIYDNQCDECKSGCTETFVEDSAPALELPKPTEPAPGGHGGHHE